MERLEQLCRSKTARRDLRRHASRCSQRGVTLVEALVALLVVSVGLLGIAALQVVGIQEGASAFRHSRATWLAYDMADRMRANLNKVNPGPPRTPIPADRWADHYVGIEVNEDIEQKGQVCGAGDACSLQQMADFDSDQWRSGIIGLPNGSGTVDEDAAVGGRYRIRVMWDEIRAGASDAVKGCPSDRNIDFTCVELWVQP